MLTLSLFILAFFTLCSCAEQYNIAGSTMVPGFGGHTLYLGSLSGGQTLQYMDSCRVIHGQFSFCGSTDSVTFARVYMGGESVLPVVIEGGALTVSIDPTGEYVTGGPLNEKLYKFMERRRQVENDLWRLDRQCLRAWQEAPSPEEARARMAEFRARGEKLVAEGEALETRFVLENQNTVLGPGFFRMLCEHYPVPVLTPQIKEIFNRAGPAFMNDPFVAYYARSVGYERPGKARRHRQSHRR